jgi:hypothetical protein
VAKVTVGYFLEDLAHEVFLRAIVERTAAEYTFGEQPMNLFLEHDPRNVTGGHGKALAELNVFLHDIRKGWVRPFDLLVVAIDGNCHSYTGRRKEIDSIVKKQQYLRPLARAVPDPHVERWYLADNAALQRVLDQPVSSVVPRYKCERDLYKNLLVQVFRETGFDVRMGGTEYGRDIVQALDFYTLNKADRAFGHFVDELKSAFSAIERGFARRNAPPG